MNNLRQTHGQAAGVMLAAFSVVIWGITFVSTKYLLKSFSSLEILALRFVMAYAVLWILCPHRLSLGGNRKAEACFAAAGLCGVTLYQFLENMAICFTTASNVSIIVSICPMFTALFSAVFLHEKNLTPRFAAGFIVAVTGIALVSFNGTVVLKLNPRGDVLALCAAVCWGLYSLCVSKINKLGVPLLSGTRRIFFWALIFMIPLGLCGALVPGFKGNDNMGITLDAALNAARFSHAANWLNLAFLGIAASAVCFFTWNTACAKLGTVRATTGIYLIPVVTAVFALVFLHEKITLMGAAGGLLTVAGLFVSSW